MYHVNAEAVVLGQISTKGHKLNYAICALLLDIAVDRLFSELFGKVRQSRWPVVYSILVVLAFRS